MDPNVPLTDLIPLWIATIKLRGQKPKRFDPYAESTLETYERRAKKTLSVVSSFSRETWSQYFGELRKRVGNGTYRNKTYGFEVDALNYFYEWAANNNLIEEHPNKDYKSRWEKGNAKKR